MKLNKFKVSVILFFKSGNSKKVDWIEDRLVKKVDQGNSEVTSGLTLEEANAFFQGKFKEWKDEGTTIVRKNIRGESSIIPFSEVEYATLTITQLGDDFVSPSEPPPPPPSTLQPRGIHEGFGKDNRVPPPPPPPPRGPGARSIMEHPAQGN